MTDVPKMWPKTLEEAVDQLNLMLDPQAIEQFKNMPLREVDSLHWDLGRHIRNSFGIWAGNTELIKACGAEHMHPDHVSSIILKAYWKKLNQWTNWNKIVLYGKSWTDLNKVPQTLEEAVNLLCVVMPQESKDPIKKAQPSEGLFYDPRYLELIKLALKLDGDNPALLEACGAKEMPPDLAAETILRALSKKLNQRADWNQTTRHWTYSYNSASSREEAVNHLLCVMPGEIKAQIKQIPPSRVLSLNLSYGKVVRRVFHLEEEGNPVLLKSCGTEGLHPANASRVILKSLWEKLNED